MDESELLFNLVYFLICMCIIYPPEEFQRLELTIEQLFSQYLGDESINFVQYHQRRTSLNLFVHSCLPAIYFLVHKLKFSIFAEVQPNENSNIDTDYLMSQEVVFVKSQIAWKVAQEFSLLIMLAAPALIFNWWQKNWKRHPISQTLIKYSNEPQSYEALATDISNEFRRPDVYRKKLNSISTVIATENWIIKTSLYNVHFAHQSDTRLSVAKTETFNVSQDNNDTLQMVSIVVKPNRQGVTDFHIRINALEFHDLEERISRPIIIPSNIQFHRNVIDRFVDVFKEEVKRNRKYNAGVTTDKCYACMTNNPDVKIHKQCEDIDPVTGMPLSPEHCCRNCYCRPMWCVDCLARWFAARQNEFDHAIWLELKSTCPLCRAQFCLLDVSYLAPETHTTGSQTNLNIPPNALL